VLEKWSIGVLGKTIVAGGVLRVQFFNPQPETRINHSSFALLEHNFKTPVFQHSITPNITYLFGPNNKPR
jgi:hypothetical protein